LALAESEVKKSGRTNIVSSLLPFLKSTISVPTMTGFEKVDAEHRKLDMLYVFIALKINVCLTERMISGKLNDMKSRS
jgi:hypothetical protein